MRLGIALPHYDTSYAGRPASWDTVKRVAMRAEACGLDSVWVSDHLFLDWAKYGGPPDVQGALECWTTLTAVAAATERVRVGSLTLCNDLRNPALVAKMAATLDLLSGGRLDVGLGAGWYEPEYAAAGIELRAPGVRIRRLREALTIIGRLLEGEEVTVAGRHYTVTGAVCTPRPHQRPRPPLWVGGKGDRLLGVAAQAADGWNFSWLGSLQTYRERLDAARRACEGRGRDPDTLRRSVGAYLVAGRDERDARRRFDRLAERTPPGVIPGAPNGGGRVSWERFQRDRVAGTVGEVIDRLGEVADLGVEEVVVSLGALPFAVADEEDVQLLGEEIAPALR
ncbi:MAG TPA: LLM class flavin-dependent oxidoreductase [Actinomycetota bacterium]|nr:LLM class flavin-dependent oxidoreductase [Actinomycetota bacterium]